MYREILGLVLEIVNKAMERSEENKVNKNFVAMTVTKTDGE